MARPALLLLVPLLPALGRAAQPGAAPPVPAPMRNLTWGQLNFLHTTDTHGWLAGHLQEPQYSADWGDYISFADHMRRLADDRGADLLLIDTGDRVEGAGLYDASDPKGVFSSSIFAAAPIDIICSGNHELYREKTARREHEVVAGRLFPDRYLASNLDYIEPDQEQADTGAAAGAGTADTPPLTAMKKTTPWARQRFRRFRTPKMGLEILAFGFVYDFNLGAANTAVRPVGQVVREQWFEDEVKRGTADVIIIIGHVGLRMHEFRDIYTAIRKLDWFTPVLFFGGHAHVRDALKFDSKSFAVASGRYFETVGWISVDGLNRKEARGWPTASSSSPSFFRRYIDNNLHGYRYHTGLNATAFPTKSGLAVSEAIRRARSALDLDHRHGCVPRTLGTDWAPYPSNQSVFSWLADRVLPDTVVDPTRAEVPRLIIFNTGGVRFDVRKGRFTRDNLFATLPFPGRFLFIPNVPYSVAAKVLDLLNSQERILGNQLDISTLGLPEHRLGATSLVAPRPGLAPESGSPSGSESESEWSAPSRLELRGEKDGEPKLTRGYTTVDDIDDQGDDTIHAKVNRFPIPNCIQAAVGFPTEGEGRPEKVDLVFVDFILPFVLPAVKLAGGDVAEGDVRPYVDKSTGELVVTWIEKNWGGDDC